MNSRANFASCITAYLFVIVVSAASVAFFCVYVVPPIQFLFSTVAKSLALALAGA